MSAIYDRRAEVALSCACYPAITVRSFETRGKALPPERAALAAQVGRLIGHARVIGAVGQAGHRLTAAEEEVRLAGIADRPTAGVFGELEQGAALADRNDVIEQL